MTQRFAFALFALLMVTPLLSGAASPSKTTTDPDRAVIITSDIDLFWSVVDGAHGNPDAKAFEEYFSKGSLGVDAFIAHRLVSPAHLADVFAKNKAYYLKTRPNMAQIPTQVARLRDDLRRYKAFYPEVQFPNLYFVVGALNSAGTDASGIGAIMGTEMFSKGPDVLQADAPSVPLATLGSIDVLAPTAAHELTHFNQHDAQQQQQTLLGQALYEGTADFMSQLADGNNVNRSEWSFGCAHEASLWKEFAATMHSQDDKVIENWLFSYAQGPLGAPPFIGYWLGSRIVQSYYQTHGDKKSALAQIMQIGDYDAFLKQSGYMKKHPACKPQPRWQN